MWTNLVEVKKYDYDLYLFNGAGSDSHHSSDGVNLGIAVVENLMKAVDFVKLPLIAHGPIPSMPDFLVTEPELGELATYLPLWVADRVWRYGGFTVIPYCSDGLTLALNAKIFYPRHTSQEESWYAYCGRISHLVVDDFPVLPMGDTVVDFKYIHLRFSHY